MSNCGIPWNIANLLAGYIRGKESIQSYIMLITYRDAIFLKKLTLYK